MTLADSDTTATKVASIASPTPKRSCSVGRNAGSTLVKASLVACAAISRKARCRPPRVVLRAVVVATADGTRSARCVSFPSRRRADASGAGEVGPP